jgi:hypothetical protein
MESGRWPVRHQNVPLWFGLAHAKLAIATKAKKDVFFIIVNQDNNCCLNPHFMDLLYSFYKCALIFRDDVSLKFQQKLCQQCID